VVVLAQKHTAFVKLADDQEGVINSNFHWDHMALRIKVGLAVELQGLLTFHDTLNLLILLWLLQAVTWRTAFYLTHFCWSLSYR
jgi:hypothetical protein